MNPEEIRRITQDVLGNVFSQDSITYWIIGLVALISAGLGAFFGGRFRQKPEQLATKEELNEILKQLKESTRASEMLRAEINRVDWVTPRQWEAKLTYYLDLVEALRNWSDLGRVAMARYDKNGELIKDFDSLRQLYEDLPKDLEQRTRSFSRMLDKAPIFLSDEALAMLDRFSNIVSIAQETILDFAANGADYESLKPFSRQYFEFWKILNRAAAETRTALQNEATKELGLKVSEGRYVEGTDKRSQDLKQKRSL